MCSQIARPPTPRDQSACCQTRPRPRRRRRARDVGAKRTVARISAGVERRNRYITRPELRRAGLKGKVAKYSIFSLVRHALSGHRHWPRAWRDPAPKPRYSVIIIGGGGHGLASAYYLDKEHSI